MGRLLCGGSGSSGNSYAIEADNGEILLIECGIPWYRKHGICIKKMINYNVSNVVGCIVSHKHKDHLGTKEKGTNFIELLKEGIKIYTNDETEEDTEIKYEEKLSGVPEKIPFQCGSFTITPFYLPHTTRDKDTGKLIPCPNFGFHIFHPEMGQLVYMTDFEYPALSFGQARIEHLLCEVNYCDELVEREEANYKHRLQGHLSLNTFKEKVLKQNLTQTMQNIILCHLSDSAADEEQILREVKEISGSRVCVNIAKPGLSVELNRFPF